MSKASEWADQLGQAKERVKELERDKTLSFFVAGYSTPVAYVDVNGSPVFETVRGTWTIEQAISLARWILDMFSEAQ